MISIFFLFFCVNIPPSELTICSQSGLVVGRVGRHDVLKRRISGGSLLAKLCDYNIKASVESTSNQISKLTLWKEGSVCSWRCFTHFVKQTLIWKLVLGMIKDCEIFANLSIEDPCLAELRGPSISGQDVLNPLTTRVHDCGHEFCYRAPITGCVRSTLNRAVCQNCLSTQQSLKPLLIISIESLLITYQRTVKTCGYENQFFVPIYMPHVEVV